MQYFDHHKQASVESAMLGRCAATAAATAHTHCQVALFPLALRHLAAKFSSIAGDKSQSEHQTFDVQPGTLLHICCTQPHTHVQLGNKPGVEDVVTLQTAGSDSKTGTQPSSSFQDSFLVQEFPGGRVIDVVQHAASSSSMGNQQQPSTVLSGTIPSRFCGLSVTTAGGSVTVGQLQEADLQLSTAGGDVKVSRCRAHNASINTALQPCDWIPAPAAAAAQTQGGSIQVGELSASHVWVYSGGSPVSIKRLFGLTVDVQSAGGALEVGSVYADRAAISSAAPAPAAAGAGAAAAAAGQRHAAAAARAGANPGNAASQGMAAGSSSSGASSSGGLHISHIACLKGEARLESGGGPLEVDGLEGNAALLSSGGNIKVHLHEHAGLVYVDTDGGAVTAWLSPSGPPLGLQVKAAGGVSLDPALQVTGEVGPTLLFGVTAGDGTMSSISSRTTAWVQQAVAAAQSSTSASGAGLAEQPIEFTSSSSSCRASSVQASARWKQSEQQVGDWSRASAAKESGCGTGAAAAAAAGSGCGCSTASPPAATRQLIINAGWGRVELKAMGWMDGLKARMEAKQGRSQS